MRPRKEAQKYIDEGYRFYNRIDDDNVKIMTIEEITSHWDTIDLAKFDCEGGEVDILQNITKEEAKKFRFIVGEYHLWHENSGYLKAPLFEVSRYWRNVKRKFEHLYFAHSGDYTRLGLFQAWPRKL